MRLFLGVFPPPDARDSLARLLSSLQRRPRLAGGRGGARWVRPERMHVTMRFLGEQPAELVPRLNASMVPVLAAVPAFDAELHGLGGFPSARRARVLWIGVGAGAAEFGDLAERIDGVLEEEGIAGNERAFRAHLTLARAGGAPLEVPSLATDLPPFRVRAVSLVQSRLGRAGGYDHLAAWPLRESSGS